MSWGYICIIPAMPETALLRVDLLSPRTILHGAGPSSTGFTCERWPGGLDSPHDATLIWHFKTVLHVSRYVSPIVHVRCIPVCLVHVVDHNGSTFVYARSRTNSPVSIFLLSNVRLSLPSIKMEFALAASPNIVNWAELFSRFSPPVVRNARQRHRETCIPTLLMLLVLVDELISR